MISKTNSVMKNVLQRLVRVVRTLFKKEKVAPISSLQLLREKGYILRIPGGSSRKAEHSSFCFIYRSGVQFEIEVLVVPYNPMIRIERKYLDDEFNEVPEGTLHLKVTEQTGCKIYQPVKLEEKSFPNTIKEVKIDKHVKHVYATEFFDESGKRTEPTTDERIAPPEWVPVSQLRNELCQQHRWMVPIFEQYLVYLSDRKESQL